jgi:regulatory protein
VSSTRAYLDALRMLARRELSEAQVRQRLARRRHDSEQIDDAVARLKQEGAIDDRRVADAIARSETSLRKRGRLRVKRKIESAGISSSVARDATDETFDAIDADGLLDAALAKRLRHGKAVADDREFNRLYRYLVSQGFEPDRVLARLRKARQDPD